MFGRICSALLTMNFLIATESGSHVYAEENFRVVGCIADNPISNISLLINVMS
jgi:hypothetical protein